MDGGRSTCLYVFAKAWILVVLICSVLRDKGIVAVGVNPLISVEKVLQVVSQPHLNKGDAGDLALAVVKRTEKVEKEKPHMALEEAWRLYEEQKQRFLRFKWKDAMKGTDYSMFVAFSREFRQHRNDVRTAMLAGCGKPFFGVMTMAQFESHPTRTEECECLAAFMVIPDGKEEARKNTENKQLETLSKMLTGYIKEDGRNQPDCYFYLKGHVWIHDVNPLLSIKDVTEATSRSRSIMMGDDESGAIKLHVLEPTESNVDKWMGWKALNDAWNLYQETESFFSFEKDDRMPPGAPAAAGHTVWVAFSGDKEVVGRYGRKMVSEMMKVVEEGCGNTLIGATVERRDKRNALLAEEGEDSEAEEEEEVVVAFMVTGATCSYEPLLDVGEHFAAFETKLHNYVNVGGHKPRKRFFVKVVTS